MSEQNETPRERWRDRTLVETAATYQLGGVTYTRVQLETLYWAISNMLGMGSDRFPVYPYYPGISWEYPSGGFSVGGTA